MSSQRSAGYPNWYPEPYVTESTYVPHVRGHTIHNNDYHCDLYDDLATVELNDYHNESNKSDEIFRTALFDTDYISGKKGGKFCWA